MRQYWTGAKGCIPIVNSEPYKAASKMTTVDDEIPAKADTD